MQRKQEFQNEKILPTARFEPNTSLLLYWRCNVLRWLGSEGRYLKVNDIHINIDTP